MQKLDILRNIGLAAFALTAVGGCGDDIVLAEDNLPSPPQPVRSEPLKLRSEHFKLEDLGSGTWFISTENKIVPSKNIAEIIAGLRKAHPGKDFEINPIFEYEDNVGGYLITEKNYHDTTIKSSGQ